MIIAKALANLEQNTAGNVAQARWGKSNPTLVRLIKANEVAGGGSGSGEWGAELVQADTRYTGDFITMLQNTTVYDQPRAAHDPGQRGDQGAGRQRHRLLGR